MPELHLPGECHEGKRERLQRLERAGDHDQPSLAHPIGDDARYQRQQHGRHELENGQEAQRRRRVGQVQHEPGLRDALQPGATLRDDLTEKVQPVVGIGKRAPAASTKAHLLTCSHTLV